jgi:hypothetical protein
MFVITQDIMKRPVYPQRNIFGERQFTPKYGSMLELYMSVEVLWQVAVNYWLHLPVYKELAHILVYVAQNIALLGPWRWRHYLPSKQFIPRCGVMYGKYLVLHNWRSVPVCSGCPVLDIHHYYSFWGTVKSVENSSPLLFAYSIFWNS